MSYRSLVRTLPFIQSLRLQGGLQKTSLNRGVGSRQDLDYTRQVSIPSARIDSASNQDIQGWIYVYTRSKGLWSRRRERQRGAR
jgi:hypothetical protein